MNDIFNNNIYPHEGKIKDHFKDFYDTVFVAFLPFFQTDRHPIDKVNLKKAKHKIAVYKTDQLTIEVDL